MTNEDINLQQIPIISQIYAIVPIIRHETPPITAGYYGRWMVKKYCCFNKQQVFLIVFRSIPAAQANSSYQKVSLSDEKTVLLMVSYVIL